MTAHHSNLVAPAQLRALLGNQVTKHHKKVFGICSEWEEMGWCGRSHGTGGKRQRLQHPVQSQAFLQRLGFWKPSVAVSSLRREGVPSGKQHPGEQVCLLFISVCCMFILLHQGCTEKPCRHPLSSGIGWGKLGSSFWRSFIGTEVSLCVVAWAVN